MSHLNQNLPFERNETESLDWSSITDSNYDSFANGSVVTNENFKAITSAKNAPLDSILESTSTLHGRSKEISLLQEAFHGLHQILWIDCIIRNR